MIPNAATREDKEVIEMLKREFPNVWAAAIQSANDNEIVGLSILKRCCMRVLEIRLGIEDARRKLDL